jgi:hypothetical protein
MLFFGEKPRRNPEPKVLVCLGATAASAIFGASVGILRDRGQLRASSFVPQTLITFLPSVFLRATDQISRDEQYRHFIDDLRLAKRCPFLILGTQDDFTSLSRRLDAAKDGTEHLQIIGYARLRLSPVQN